MKLSYLKIINIIKTLVRIYLSLLIFQTVTAKPADKSSAKSDSKKDLPSSTKNSSPSTTVNNSKVDIGNKKKCQPNTNSCDTGYSCIRFNSDKENNYTCVKNEYAYCTSGNYCKEKLGNNYKFCYTPPWNKSGRQQCFTEQISGSHCLYNIHCVNNLDCVKNVCVSTSLGDLDDPSSNYDGDGKNNNKNTILGINKWIFISAIAFPIIVLCFFIWCWIIGRSSSKNIENKKKERYENELKENALPHNNKNNKNQNSAPESPKYVDPRKEIEEEVGKRGFRSLFSKKKKEEEDETPKKSDPADVDVSSPKSGSKSPTNTNTSDTPKKKKNLTLVNLNEKNTTRPPKKATPALKSPTTPAGSKTSSVASFRDSGSNTSSGHSKPRVPKKKPAVKKAKKTGSHAGNDTNTNNSSSSKQSSQRGLVNNASNMSSALSGQSASYFSGVSSLDAQSALYYQQMYNAAAAQAAAQNPYYASYMQNPYYAAAAAQSAAYYAQDPNAVYGSTYQNPSFQ